MPHQPFRSLDPEHRPANRQDASRARVGLQIEARQGTQPWNKVRIEDLSPGGCKLIGLGAVDPAQPIRIRLPGLQILSARMCWQIEEERSVGCEFHTPLYPAVFEHIVKHIGA